MLDKLYFTFTGKIFSDKTNFIGEGNIKKKFHWRENMNVVSGELGK